jgi:uncharacterized protein
MAFNKVRIAAITAVMIAVVMAGLNACKKDEPEPEPPGDTFDRTALLTNFADSMIIPQYTAYDLELDTLAAASNAFVTTTDLTNLYALRAAFQSAYFSYQSVSIFEFGPAESELIRTNCNTFPTDTAQINVNITNGTYDLFLASNIDAKGFPALDYLLYGRNQSDATIVTLFSTSANRRQYITTLVQHLQTHLQNVLNAWTTSYRGTFISSNGNSIGSSLGYLVNQLNYDLELIKNAKIGIPLGKMTLNIPVPEKCENYYSGQSVWLAAAALDNIENCYLGRSTNGNDGAGFDNYLDHLGAQYQSQSLNSAIQAKFADAKIKLAAVPDPLSAEVVNNPAVVDSAYMAIKRLTVLLKTDMPSNLGIVITYQDTDGD